MTYRIELTPAAYRDLKQLRGPILKRVRDVIDDLASDPRPHGVRKLTGEENLWRVRVGDYRVIYSINDGKLLVLVVRLGHRRDVYE